MYSMKRISRPLFRAKPTRSRISSSLIPRMITALILIGDMPAPWAAKSPFRTSSRFPRFVKSRKRSALSVSILTLILLRPAAARLPACSASSAPFVVSDRSPKPSIFARRATSLCRSFRTRGSPPVRRIFSTPNSRKSRANRSISSNDKTSWRSIHLYSSNGIQ